MPATSAPAVQQATPISRKAAAIGDLKSVYEVVADDFTKVNELIPKCLSSDVNLVEDIGSYIIESGGKRLRPLMVLLGTRAAGYNGTEHIELATVIEFLHTATLLHDDVVDQSNLRRGKDTANAVWGNAPSVLVGDFLYSRAFQLMVQLKNFRIMEILSDATNTIAEGEVMQLANLGNFKISEAQYMETIRCKTALLFEAATHTAGALASQEEDTVIALRDFGLHFGLAYQLVDDCLDYSGDATTMGKNAGDDLAEGKVTLPLMHALEHGDAVDRDIITTALHNKDVSALPEVLSVMCRTDSLAYAQRAAIRESERALHCLQKLPASDAKTAMTDLTHYCLSRLS